MFQSSVLKSFSQNESLVAIRWAKFQKFLSKVDYIKTVKEEKYQDGFLKDIFENDIWIKRELIKLYKLDNRTKENIIRFSKRKPFE